MGNRILKRLEADALRFRRMEDWGEDALRANARILDVDPHNFAALVRSARCYREMGNLSVARETYLRALELAPGNNNVRKALEEIEEGGRKQRELEKYIEKICSMKSFNEVYKIAKTYKDKALPQRRIAVEAFKQAFRLDRRRTGILIELAAVQRTMRQRDEAQRIYEWILKRDDEHSIAKVGLAAIYKDRKRLRDGLKLCDEVLVKDPHNPYALRCRAGILSELDRGSEAAESFENSFRASGNRWRKDP
jgi:tetratricopeptide (TPR) repeat protein